MIPALMPTYNRLPVRFERGEGMYLYDETGKAHLDFYAGIGVNCLGHCHPYLVSALKDQAEKLWHVANIYEIPGQERMARRLVDLTFADTVFFNNSGAEAIETAIKMVRKYHYDKGNAPGHRIITFSSAFHGRTLGGIAAAGQEKLVKGFEPIPEGFDVVDFCDLDAVKAAITPETGGIMVEPVQGEGGIRPIPADVLQGLRKIADENNLLLVFDEIQCGVSRTGKFFAHEWADVKPDIVTIAKGIGGGFPMGACLATEEAASGMTGGTHGTTFGGNPLAMAVGNAVLDIVTTDDFLEHSRAMGAYLHERLHALQHKHDGLVSEVRGLGLMAGIRIPDCPNPRAVLKDMVHRGLCPAVAGQNVVRLLPPLILEKTHVDAAVEIMDTALAHYAQKGWPEG
ncbi:aspartate aminotransferase family protein [Yunchengibacter salinarum]|uniref:aspartate aminotransferase family protein n=1 Tax=Yunchengibacter salinarum TaxID=3133399 RepID=UPI0035B61715